MRMRVAVVAVLAAAAAGCANGKSTLTVHVTAEAPVAGVDHLMVTVTEKVTPARSVGPIAVALASGNMIPPDDTFALTFDGDVRSTVAVAVEAVSATGAALAAGEEDVAVTPSQASDVTVTVSAGGGGGGGAIGRVSLIAGAGPNVGAPSEAKAGDVVLVGYINCDAATVTAPSTMWQKLGPLSTDAGCDTTLFYRVAAADDATNGALYTFNAPAMASSVRLIYRGAASVLPATDSTELSPFSIPSVTTTAANSVVIALLRAAVDGCTMPAGTTNQQVTSQWSVVDIAVPAAGASGARGWTCKLGGSDSGGEIFELILAP